MKTHEKWESYEKSDKKLQAALVRNFWLHGFSFSVPADWRSRQELVGSWCWKKSGRDIVLLLL